MGVQLITAILLIKKRYPPWMRLGVGIFLLWDLVRVDSVYANVAPLFCEGEFMQNLTCVGFVVNQLWDICSAVSLVGLICDHVKKAPFGLRTVCVSLTLALIGFCLPASYYNESSLVIRLISLSYIYLEGICTGVSHVCAEWGFFFNLRFSGDRIRSRCLS